MRVVLLVVLCACNQVFGLQATRVVDADLTDAELFDAPADAPFACPPLGTQPRFKPALRQPVLEDCLFYTASMSGRAAAYCNDTS